MHAAPGDLVHVGVKKLGRIPDGGGWRVHGRGKVVNHHARVGFDYIHAMVDDHSRLAYAEVMADERGATCAGFLTRAAAAFATAGIGRIERVLTDNAGPTAAAVTSSVPWPRSGPGRSSSARTAPGRTRKWSASTEPWPPSGPTGCLTPPTRTEHWPWRPGWSTTTPDAHNSLQRQVTDQPPVTNVMAGYN